MKSLTEAQLHGMMEKAWLKGAMEYYDDFNYDRDAALAYNKEAERLHKEFAKLN
jgi:hypothetical protein